MKDRKYKLNEKYSFEVNNNQIQLKRLDESIEMDNAHLAAINKIIELEDEIDSIINQLDDSIEGLEDENSYYTIQRFLYRLMESVEKRRSK